MKPFTTMARAQSAQKTPSKTLLPNTWHKIMAYYALHISIAAAIGFAITGSWMIAVAVSVIEPAVQVVAWCMQRWEQRDRTHTMSHIMNHSAMRHKQRHMLRRYLARYARAA